jgi:hypothetical protein
MGRPKQVGIRIDELRAEWEKLSRRRAELTANNPFGLDYNRDYGRRVGQPPITARHFIETLEYLYRYTGEPSFKQALAALSELRIITADGGWNRSFKGRFFEQGQRNIFEQICQRKLDLGCAWPLAMAEVAVERQLVGHSWEALMAELKRLCAAHSRRTNPGEDVPTKKESA